MRPILRPGTHVLRRGAGELQVGLDPRSRAGAARHRRGPASARGCWPSPPTAAEHADPATVDLLAQHDLRARRAGPGPRCSAATDLPAAGHAPPWPGPPGRRGRGAPHGARRLRHRRGRLRAPGRGRPAARPGRPARRGRAPRGSPGRPRPTAACWSASASRTASWSTPWTRAGTPYLARPADRGPRRRRPVRRARARPPACAASTRTTPTPTRPGRCSSGSTPPPSPATAPTAPPSRSTRCSRRWPLAWAARDLASYVDGGGPPPGRPP